MRTKTWSLIVGLAIGIGHPAPGGGEPPEVVAGALLAAGKPAEAAEAALTGRCPGPRCALVRGRALFGLGRLVEAAAVLHEARAGALLAHAAQLEGEARLLAGQAGEALEPLQTAAGAPGPAGLRASALLADALLAAGDPAGALREAGRAEGLPGQPAEVRAGLRWVAAQATPAPQRAQALRAFWLQHPEHPAAQAARDEELSLAKLPPPSGRELVTRASRLLSAGQPAAAVAQAQASLPMLSGEDRAEGQLLVARCLAADGRRSEAGPPLQEAFAHGGARVAASAGMLLARDRARKGGDAEAIAVADAVAKRFPASAEAEESVLFTARLLADAGKRAQARARLAKLARKRSGSNASAARWSLAWMSRQDGLGDTVERFAEFAASAGNDEDRAQGTYWQARAGKQAAEHALLLRVVELEPLGWYGLLARERLGQAATGVAPFPPARTPGATPPELALSAELLSLGLRAEAGAEADWYVQHHPGDAAGAALSLYERAGRFDRSVTIAESLLGGRGARAPRALLEAAYPTAFPAEVQASAQRGRLDPYLLLSVMRRESLFKPDTRSAAGAVGLLQLLPATARRAAVVLGRPPLRDEQLVVPATAIDLGAWYLAELLARFGDPAVALAAYNAGPRVAAPWAARGAGRELDEWVEDIPYRETRKYVKIVIGSWSAYRQLAGGAPPALSARVRPPGAGVEF